MIKETFKIAVLFIYYYVNNRVNGAIIYMLLTLFRLRLDDPVEISTELTANNSAHFACVGSLIYTSRRHGFIKAKFL